jgi:methylmalonyl-CoA/ethylmalonyl-CoA epimerase
LRGIEAFAGRSIFQIAFVVGDLEQALARHSALLPAGGWRCWTFGSRDHERCEYRGRPAEFSCRLALNDQTPQLELIQPLTGASTYRDWLHERGEGPHHVGIVVDSVADAAAQAVRAGLEVVQSGAGIGGHRDGAWAYIDTSAALGLMVEAVELATEMPPAEFTWPGPAPRA